MKFALPLVATFFIHVLSFAQSPGAGLSKVIQQCNYSFEQGNIEDIKRSFPLIEQQELILAMQKVKHYGKAGQSKLLKLNKDSALVLLTGTFLFGNSGDETDYANTYSGVYVDIP